MLITCNSFVKEKSSCTGGNSSWSVGRTVASDCVRETPKNQVPSSTSPPVFLFLNVFLPLRPLNRSFFSAWLYCVRISPQTIYWSFILCCSHFLLIIVLCWIVLWSDDVRSVVLIFHLCVFQNLIPYLYAFFWFKWNIFSYFTSFLIL